MKNILIIGGSSGIGGELTKILAQNGNKVFASFNKTIKDDQENINFFKLNVFDDSYDIYSVLPSVLDGVVYCPGSINLKPFNRIKVKEFIDDFNLQVIGAIRIIQDVLPLLRKSETASIVLFSTVACRTGFPFHSQVSVSKGAIEGLMRSLSAELAPQTRVNCIAPSLTDTPLAKNLLNTESKRKANSLKHPLKKIGSTSDIAYAVEYLLSQKSQWITGQIISVDGGLSTIKL